MLIMIRVGRKYSQKVPKYEGFIPIVSMTASTKYGDIGPYSLKREGVIFENYWQFSKVYPKVPKTTQHYSRWDNTVVWEHHQEEHVLNDELLPAYWRWRQKGFANPYPVRYPVGFHHRHECLYFLHKVDENESSEFYKPMDYVEARKEGYLKEYVKILKTHPTFKKLKKILKEGKNLLIIESDGPHQESLEYYKKKYNVDDDFIEDDSMLATRENLEIMLNDTKHAFGHGYCIAWALLNLKIVSTTTMKFCTTVSYHLDDYRSDSEDPKKVLLWKDSSNEHTMKKSREELMEQGYKIETESGIDMEDQFFYITWTVEIPED